MREPFVLPGEKHGPCEAGQPEGGDRPGRRDRPPPQPPRAGDPPPPGALHPQGPPDPPGAKRYKPGKGFLLQSSENKTGKFI